MNDKLQKWRKDGKYLPNILRDFHDQKDVFKTMHTMLIDRPNDTIKRPSWVEGHCYVIDNFLWFMARFGYTLQKSRTKIEFEDLQNAINTIKEYNYSVFAANAK